MMKINQLHNEEACILDENMHSKRKFKYVGIKKCNDYVLVCVKKTKTILILNPTVLVLPACLCLLSLENSL